MLRRRRRRRRRARNIVRARAGSSARDLVDAVDAAATASRGTFFAGHSVGSVVRPKRKEQNPNEKLRRALFLRLVLIFFEPHDNRLALYYHRRS